MGAEATALILQWQLTGYSQDQIVDMLILGVEIVDKNYGGDFAEGEEECGGYVIGGVHEIPQFCDPETGELFPDEDESDETETTDDEPTEAVEAVPSGLCEDNFAPPYTLAIKATGVMLETEVIGPLDTPYYYTEVVGFLDIAVDGTFTLTANTVRYADITIRAAPDNQIYKREFDLGGTFNLATGDGEITGTVKGTNQLWSGDSENPVGPFDTGGPVAIVCDEVDGSFTIFGETVGGAILEFEAGP